MSSHPPVVIAAREFAQALRRHWKLWLAPTVGMTLIALIYALVRPNTWEATQVLHVRNEAAGTVVRPGQFESVDAMQTAQETLLELARNRSTLAAVLAQAGPPANRRAKGTWPDGDAIDALAGNIHIGAPHGAEFGRTEVLHVSVKANTRERAVVLTTALCDELERNLQELRNKRSAGVIDELTRSLELAQIDLQAATRKLEDLEADIGRDLQDLRVLNQSSMGESNLRTTLAQIKGELRTAKITYQDKVEQLKHLREAQRDTSNLVAMPNRLLESQPALKRLKDGLVDAQIKRAELAGSMSKNHPKVQAAMAAEAEVLANLRRELEVAVRGLEADVQISQTLIESLEKQRNEVEGRLERLSSVRARYHNLEAEVKQRSEIVQKATKDLADARANQAAASAASLITRIDGPQLGTYPLGPGRTTICLAGLFGGLACGMGLVFLVSPIGQAAGRRWSDSVAHFGRRATDLFPQWGRRKSDHAVAGRRAGDPPPVAAPSAADAIPGGRRSTDPPADAAPASRERRSGQDRRKS